MVLKRRKINSCEKRGKVSGSLSSHAFESNHSVTVAASVNLQDWGHLIELSGITDCSGSEILHCLKLEEVSSCCVCSDRRTIKQFAEN